MIQRCMESGIFIPVNARKSPKFSAVNDNLHVSSHVRTAVICIWIAAKSHLARECVSWLEYPHSVLDETTYKQAKSLVIGHPGSL